MYAVLSLSTSIANRNNLGVATFLILEKQRHLAGVASEKLNTPEGEAARARPGSSLGW